MNIDAAALPYLPEEMNIDVAAASPYLPEELVIENILTRLPFRTLAQYSCISKLWCNSISNDAQFAKTHFAHNKNRKLNLVFNLLNVWTSKGGASFFSLDSDYKFRLLMNVENQSRAELVGYCNGFACITLVRKKGSGRNFVNIINPIRREILSLPYTYPKD
ncbi:F-box protein At1g52495-like [Papaver somniferum]|uniref:F-box protein At1g52495-like n=1 Tax=Papaver somniferum TaxID=3469 RepID=UPI000E6FE388|nr:F-box protein At1g52495-like [Papaver somniferum]